MPLICRPLQSHSGVQCLLCLSAGVVDRLCRRLGVLPLRQWLIHGLRGLWIELLVVSQCDFYGRHCLCLGTHALAHHSPHSTNRNAVASSNRSAPLCCSHGLTIWFAQSSAHWRPDHLSEHGADCGPIHSHADANAVPNA